MPYFDKQRKKWKGVVKHGKERFTHLFQTKTEAKGWETDKLRELENPILVKTGTGIDLLTVCNDYLDFSERRFAHITYCEKKKLCKDILKKWGNVSVNEITPSMVIKHLEERAKLISNSAWNKDRKNLLAMFNWLRKIHGVTNNPVMNVDRLPEDRKTEYIPPGEDIDRVMMVCGEQDRVMLQSYYFTFARKSEIFNWKWEDINFEKQWYRLWTKKRLHSDNQVDYFPLPEGSELYKALKWQWDHRNKTSPYIFTNLETGEKFVSRRRFLKGLCKRAGVASFSFKAFRKYGPSVLNDVHKVSMKKLQTLLRHQNQKTTEIYLKRVDSDLSASIMLLEKRDTHRDTQTKNGLTMIG